MVHELTKEEDNHTNMNVEKDSEDADDYEDDNDQSVTVQDHKQEFNTDRTDSKQYLIASSRREIDKDSKNVTI